MRIMVSDEPPLVENWKPPPANWVKVNVDAAFKMEEAVAAMVVRDNEGKILLLDTCIFTAMSAFDAEIKTLNWAASKASSCGWKNLIWISDAKEAVRLILDHSVPANWPSRDEIKFLRNIFTREDWKLEWNCRPANKLADISAKFSLSNSRVIFYYEFSIGNLPKCISDCVLVEQLAAALLRALLHHALSSSDVRFPPESHSSLHEGVKLYVYNSRSRHVEGVRLRAMEAALADASSHGMSSKDAGKQAVKEGAKAAKLATKQAKRIELILF
ncbi:hypothetical protein FNV43_RR06075 [Rhamnella rubrinervis]|uniref:RNase H type-1 domain-containing protein n=1 Tax=Rhamnella rubrinervis TaxID=2594499 RepID=A0A8K0HCS4_9ROSA|nr:hypothetical protein FNV43_RR06075 [Rhamnella rubrinervis]